MREIVQKYKRRSIEFYRELTGPQRLSLGALGVTVLVALILLAVWGVSEDLVPVFYSGYEEIDAEQRGRIEAKLTEMAIRYEYRGGILHVPAEEKERVIAALYAEPGVLPDTAEVWSWIWEPDWTGTEERTRRKVTISLERKLSRMIESFHSVRDAEVQIAPGDENRTFVEEKESRASVMVRLKGRDDQLTKQEVIAISQMLSGAVQDLKATAVQISDTSGRHYKVPDQEEFGTMPLDQLEVKQAFDEYYTELARRALGPLGRGAHVVASIDLDMSVVEEWIRTVPKGSATIEEEIIERSRTARQEGPDEPGVLTNTERDLGSVGPQNEEENEIETRRKIVNDQKELRRKIPAGTITKKRFVVYLPYELAVRTPAGKMPEEESVQEANRQAAIDRYNKALAILTDVEPSEVHVEVMTFPEEVPIPEPGPAEYARWIAEEHGGKIFLGLLALVAVVVVTRTLNKAVPPTPEEEVVIEEEPIDKNLEALMRSRTPGRFDARTQVIRDKIQDIIDENPRGVSAMLRQWARKE